MLAKAFLNHLGSDVLKQLKLMQGEDLLLLDFNHLHQQFNEEGLPLQKKQLEHPDSDFLGQVINEERNE